MRPSKRAALALVLILALLAGCGSASAVPARQHSVALVAKSTETEFWLSVFAGAQAAAAEYNLKLTVTGPDTEEDYESQNAMVEQAVADGAEALVFSAIDFSNNASAIDAAAAAGVKIVAIDSNVDSTAVSTYIGTDNYAAGRMAAQAALDRVEGELRVGIVNYDISSANGQEREQGAVDMFDESGRARVVQVINTLAEAQHAQADTAAMLQQYPEINVLLAFNEPTSVGAAEAVRQRGVSDAVFLVGLEDEDEEYLRSLEHALRNPAFPLFLGRRSCPPTLPLCLGMRDGSLEQALRAEPSLVPVCRGDTKKRKIRVLLETGPETYGAVVQQDLPLSFSPEHRQYGYRAVREEVWDTVPLPEPTEHDPFEELR